MRFRQQTGMTLTGVPHDSLSREEAVVVPFHATRSFLTKGLKWIRLDLCNFSPYSRRRFRHSSIERTVHLCRTKRLTHIGMSAYRGRFLSLDRLDLRACLMSELRQRFPGTGRQARVDGGHLDDAWAWRYRSRGASRRSCGVLSS